MDRHEKVKSTKPNVELKEELKDKSKEIGHDNVNHPIHYSECSIECIEMMELFLGKQAVCKYCLGNAFKYLWRYKHKNGKEDIKKAKWYLNHYLKISPNTCNLDYYRLSELCDKLIEKEGV